MRTRSPRTVELAKIHIAAQQLLFDDASYRDMLWSIARVRSAKDLDAQGRAKVLAHLRSQGFVDSGKPGETRYKKGTPEALIGWLWACLHKAGVVRDGSDRALRRYIAQHAGMAPAPGITEVAPQHLTTHELNTVIEQLKGWCADRKVFWE